MTTEDVLDAFRHADEPVLTAPEVASAIESTRSNVTGRLEELFDSGVLRRKSTAEGGTVWWLPGYTDTSANGPHPEARRNDDDTGLPDRFENVVHSLDLDDAERPEECRGAVYAACLSLHRNGPSAPDELRGEVSDDVAWEREVLPVLESLPFVVREDGRLRIEG